MKLKINNKYQEVDFWSFVKCQFLIQIFLILIFYGLSFIGLFIIGVLVA